MEHVLQLGSNGEDKAALPLVKDLIQEDPGAFGEDADEVVFDYAMLALLQSNTGASREAHRTVRRIFGIPPEPPLFRFNDPDSIFSALAVHFDVSFGGWNGEALFRFFVDTLASGGRTHDAARAAGMQWMGHTLTMENQLAEARIALSASLDVFASAVGPLSPRRTECFFQLAIVEEALCEPTAARRHYVRAIQLALHGCERQQSDVLHYLEDYVSFLRGIDSRPEADFIQEIEGHLRMQFFPLR